MMAPCALTLGLLFWADALLLVAAADLAIFLVAVVDLWSLPGQRAFSAEREMLRTASLQKPHAVALTVNNHSRRKWKVAIRDDVPQEFVATPDEFERKVEQALAEGTAGEGRGFVLMPSASPYGRKLTPHTLRNYETMVRRVEAW